MRTQAPSIILPYPPVTVTSVEAVADLLEHTSTEFSIELMQEKTVYVFAQEIITAGVPGPLNCWIECSPFPTANSFIWPPGLPISASYWAAIGGGGGVLPPTAPLVEAPTGVPGAVHTFMLNWNIHSGFARLVVQTPAGALPTAYWVVQAIVAGKTPGM